MKNFLLTFVCICFLLVMVSSCDDIYNFSLDTTNDYEIVVDTLSDGGIIRPGDLIRYRIVSQIQTEAEGEEEKALRKLEIRLFSEEEDLLSTIIEEVPEYNLELTPLELPDLESFPYVLEFIFFLGDTILAEKRMEFLYVNDIYKIKGIKSFPTVIFPESTVLLEADLEIPIESDPYFRWSLNDTVVSRGFLSEGSGSILWDVPPDQGIYSIKVEIFPLGPSEGKGLFFASTSNMNTDLYISKDQAHSPRDLFPEESYHTLLHFWGNLKDFGVETGLKNNKRTEADPIGYPELITMDDSFAYKLDESSGFRLPRLIIPIKDKWLTPATFTFGLSFEKTEALRDLLNIKAEDDSYTFRIFIDKNLRPAAEFKSPNQTILMPSGIEELIVGNRVLLSLSLFPSEDNLTATWFMDGIESNSITQSTTRESLLDQGESLIGVGFSGIIDEFGVFFRDQEGRYTVDTEIYETAMIQKFGKNLVLAQGFDGPSLPDDFVLEGEGIPESGVFILRSDSSLTLPEVPLDDEIMEIELALPSPVVDTGIIDFIWNGQEEPFIEIYTSGSVIFSGQASSPIALKEVKDNLNVKIYNEDNIKAEFEGEEGIREVEIPPPGQDTTGLILKITNTKEAEEPLILDRITIINQSTETVIGEEISGEPTEEEIDS